MNTNEESQSVKEIKAISINASDFEKVVKQSSVPVLVDWWAPWCGPCRTLAPVMDKLAKEFSGNAVVVKVDCEENMDIAFQMNIKSLPTVTVWSEGKECNRLIGLRSIDEYRKNINSAIEAGSNKT